MQLLSEPGLYFFVARSDKPRALPFQKWLAGEVLPSLRRLGRYEMPSRNGSQPVGLSPAALRLRPALRERILGSAMQCARLMGATSMAEVEGIFCRCCELVASTPEQPLLPADREAGLIRDFMQECCQSSKGAKTTAAAVYDRFRVWWNSRSKEPLPSQKRLGALLQERFVRHRRGVGGSMGALSPEERAKLRAVADMIPDLPELRQAQKCKVAISVLFHVLRLWKPIFEKAAPEQYTKICKWLAVVATGYAARVKRRREVEYALEKMENRLRPYLKKTGLPPERRAFLACAMLAAALTLMDDARATCPLYARTGAWRYACQTTDTLVTALMRAFPGCDERGTEIYFDLTR